MTSDQYKLVFLIVQYVLVMQWQHPHSLTVNLPLLPWILFSLPFICMWTV